MHASTRSSSSPHKFLPIKMASVLIFKLLAAAAFLVCAAVVVVQVEGQTRQCALSISSVDIREDHPVDVPFWTGTAQNVAFVKFRPGTGTHGACAQNFASTVTGPIANQTVAFYVSPDFANYLDHRRNGSIRVSYFVRCVNPYAYLEAETFSLLISPVNNRPPVFSTSAASALSSSYNFSVPQIQETLIWPQEKFINEGAPIWVRDEDYLNPFVIFYVDEFDIVELSVTHHNDGDAQAQDYEIYLKFKPLVSPRNARIKLTAFDGVHSTSVLINIATRTGTGNQIGTGSETGTRITDTANKAATVPKAVEETCGFVEDFEFLRVSEDSPTDVPFWSGQASGIAFAEISSASFDFPYHAICVQNYRAEVVTAATGSDDPSAAQLIHFYLTPNFCNYADFQRSSRVRGLIARLRCIDGSVKFSSEFELNITLVENRHVRFSAPDYAYTYLLPAGSPGDQINPGNPVWMYSQDLARASGAVFLDPQGVARHEMYTSQDYPSNLYQDYHTFLLPNRTISVGTYRTGLVARWNLTTSAPITVTYAQRPTL